MFEKIFIKNKWAVYATTILGVVAVISLPNEYGIWGVLMFILLPFIYACSKIPVIINLINNKWKTFVFIFTSLFFIFKIVAANALGLQYEVNPEYIDNSAILLSGFYTPIIIVFICSIVILAFLVIKSIFLSIKNMLFFTTEDKSAAKTSVDILIVIFPLMFFAYLLDVTSKLPEYVLYSDSHAYSDCLSNVEDKSAYITYLRKNDNECYKITSEFVMIPWNLTYEVIQAKKL